MMGEKTHSKHSLKLVLIVSCTVVVILATLVFTGKLNNIIYRPLQASWIDVPSGDFLMGSDTQSDEKPARTVYLDSFQIMKYEVTNKQYAQCVRNGVCREGGQKFSYERKLKNRLYIKIWKEHPVVGVSWFDAKTYCEWIGARLPTEAEWEKAARGTDGRIYPWGNEFDESKFNGNKYNGFQDTAPVGTFTNGQSPYGVHDLAGNVWEWTDSWYEVYPGGDPTGLIFVGQSHRVVRGGSWWLLSSYIASSRGHLDPKLSARYDVGFRCARDVTE